MMTSKRHLWSAGVLLVTACAVVVLVGNRAGLAQLAPAGGPVAVCDVVEAFNNYDRAQDLSEEAERERTAVLAEHEKRVADLKAMNEELSGLRPGSDDYEALLRDIQRKTIETEAWQDYKMVLAARDQHRLMTEMYEEILTMVQTVAEEQDYQLVLFRETRETQTDSIQQLYAQMESRKVLYSSPSVDITQTVLARLNRQYQTANP